MRKLPALAILLLGYSLHGQNVTLRDPKPVLAAIQVKDLDSSIYFYSKYLGFELTERTRFDDYHLEIAFLKNGQFEIELVMNDSSIDKKQILKEKGVTDITGFAKLNFEIKQIEQFYNFLTSEHAYVVLSLRQSTRNKNFQTFIITDPEGNWIQFTGK